MNVVIIGHANATRTRWRPYIPARDPPIRSLTNNRSKFYRENSIIFMTSSRFLSFLSILHPTDPAIFLMVQYHYIITIDLAICILFLDTVNVVSCPNEASPRITHFGVPIINSLASQPFIKLSSDSNQPRTKTDQVHSLPEDLLCFQVRHCASSLAFLRFLSVIS